MVSTFFRTAVVCLAAHFALATPLERRAAPSLKVEVSTGSASIASVQDLGLTAVVTNTGAETLKVLKYGTVLDDKLPTKSFQVTTAGGKTVPFTGIKLSVSLSDADDSAFTTLAPGESVTTTHDLSSVFDFSAAGAGSFKFAPLTDFVVVDSEVSTAAKHVEGGREFAKLEAASVESNTVTVEITADVAARTLESNSGLQKRSRVTCSNTSRASFISASYSEAKSLASGGVSYINSRGTSDSLYRSYWGSNSASRVNSVLNGVANENSNSRTLSCTDTYGACSGGVIAYTVIATTNIYYCSIFFNEVPTANLCSGTSVASRNVRGGTTLHEITHAVSGTDDVTYGCAADQALSDSRKIINADNYNCFTTQVYANTRC